MPEPSNDWVVLSSIELQKTPCNHIGELAVDLDKIDEEVDDGER
jgi:hypothetical protein